jgi:hypothetical protein
MTATPRSSTARPGRSRSQRAREKAHTREGTRLPTLAGGCRWSRSTRGRRWPPTGPAHRHLPGAGRSNLRGARRRVRVRDRPGRVCDVDLIWEQVVVDAHDPVALEIRPTPDRLPGLLFVPVPEEKAGKNRLHPDFRPVDQTAEVERLLSLGARRATIEHPARPPQVVTTQKPLDNRAEAGAPKLGCLVLATIRARGLVRASQHVGEGPHQHLVD